MLYQSYVRAFLVLTAYLGFGHALMARKPSDIENPMKNPKACGRNPKIESSAICDPDHLLIKDDADIIEGYINAVTKAQIGVTIISKMDTSGYSNANAAAKVFATWTHNSWGVGSADTNDGILIFLSIQDRVIYISTGTGVMDRIPPSVVDSLIRLMKPSLKKAEYGVAVQNCIIQIDLTLSGNTNADNMRQVSGSAYDGQVSEIGRAYGGGSGESSWEDTAGTFGIFGGAICIFSYMVYAQNKQMRNLERGRAALDRLMREVPAAELGDGGGGPSPGGAPGLGAPATGAGTAGSATLGDSGSLFHGTLYMSKSCPICLEDFPATVAQAPAKPEVTAVHMSHTDVADIDTDDVTSASLLVGQEVGQQGQMGHVYGSTETVERGVDVCPNSSSSSSSSSPEVANTRESRPMALQCGHTFCHGCLDTFLRQEGNNKCPICRAPVTDGGDASSGRRPPTSGPQRPGLGSPGAGAEPGSGGEPTVSFGLGAPPSAPSAPSCSAQTSGHSFPSYHTGYGLPGRAPELRFRLNRMRHLYPDVMTMELLRTMNSAIDRNSAHDLRQSISTQNAAVQRRITDIRTATQRSAKRSGSSGSSRSFGGGRSGGGGGGSW